MDDQELGSILKEVLPPGSRGFLKTVLELAVKLKQQSARPGASEAEKRTAACLMLSNLLHGVGAFIGNDALALVYGDDPPEEADRGVHLVALWWRLNATRNLFKTIEDQEALSSLRSLADEVMAVSQGDAPRLLARTVSGGRGLLVNKYRLARHRLRVLEWEQFLLGKGYSPGEVQGVLTAAYNQPWATMRGWRAQVDESLGSDVTDYILGLAAHGMDVAFFDADTLDDARPRIAADAAAMTLERANTPSVRPAPRKRSPRRV